MSTPFKNFDNLMNADMFITKEEQTQINLINKLVELREEKGLTQQDLAKMSGVKLAELERIENNKTTPAINTLIKLLNSLGHTLEIVPIDKK